MKILFHNLKINHAMNAIHINSNSHQTSEIQIWLVPNEILKEMKDRQLSTVCVFFSHCDDAPKQTRKLCFLKCYRYAIYWFHFFGFWGRRANQMVLFRMHNKWKTQQKIEMNKQWLFIWKLVRIWFFHFSFAKCIPCKKQLHHSYWN